MKKKQWICYAATFAASAVRLMGANPFLPGVVALMGCENLTKPLVMIAYSIGLSLFVPYLMGIKYFLICTCILIGEALVRCRRRGVSTPMATLITGVSVFGVGMSGEIFSLSRYGVIVVGLEATFGMSLVLCFKQLFHEGMLEKKKLFANIRATAPMPKTKLMGYAKAVEKLSDSLYNAHNPCMGAVALSGDGEATVIQKGLKALAGTLIDTLQEKEYLQPNKEEEICRLEYAMSEKGITGSSFCYLEDGQGRGELTFQVEIGKKQKVTYQMLLKLVRDAFGTQFMVKEKAGTYLSEGAHVLCMLQRGRFQLRYSAVGMSKEEGEPCGDNFSVLRGENGKTTLMLSDGLGSGQMACRQSESVLELIEELLEAGFLANDALSMANGALAARNEDGFSATVDLCEFDEFTGEAVFYKMGAPAGFLIRKNQVELLEGTGLPAGAFVENSLTPMYRKLYDGDYLVLASDGVLDAMGAFRPEETMRQVLRMIPKGNPGAMAQQIMKIAKETKGTIADDCMVLVAGIWER